MILVRSRRRLVGGWIHPGKRLELPDEVRLVVVVTRERDTRPLDLPSLVHALQHPLEATNPTEDFRRDPDVGGKDVEEAPVAETNTVDGECGPLRRTRPDVAGRAQIDDQVAVRGRQDPFFPV